jgi:hypothetical protein
MILEMNHLTGHQREEVIEPVVASRVSWAQPSLQRKATYSAMTSRAIISRILMLNLLNWPPVSSRARSHRRRGSAV